MPESRLTIQRWLYHPIAATIPKPQIAALSYAVLYVALCYLPVLVLYRRRIFVKV
jgi:predicted acyltransferase